MALSNKKKTWLAGFYAGLRKCGCAVKKAVKPKKDPKGYGLGKKAWDERDMLAWRYASHMSVKFSGVPGNSTKQEWHDGAILEMANDPKFVDSLRKEYGD